MAQVLKFTKVQELIYELPIERVMKKEVVGVSPDTTMTQLKEVLRVNRISGVPVLDGTQLAGVISIEDLIKALVEGDIQAPVRKRMTTRMITVLENESVVEAVKKFAQFKVGRLLVINEEGDLRGILTGGDITRGLLEAISLDYHAEEISRYRAKHIFEDIISDQTSLILRYGVKAGDFKKGGNASSKVKRALDRLGAIPEVIRRVAISAYEAEMNLIIHADEGGELIAEMQPESIRITAVDRGPGIPDVEKAMSPGFSTAPNWIRELGFGAGMGLTNIKKCADLMELKSTVGVGTKLEIVFYLRPESRETESKEKERMISLKQVIDRLKLEPVASPRGIDHPVAGGYATDLLSCAMKGAKEGDLWVTLQSHLNVVAVASLLNLAGVIITEGHRPDRETIARAESEGVTLIVTSRTTYSVVGQLALMGVKGEP